MFRRCAFSWGLLITAVCCCISHSLLAADWLSEEEQEWIAQHPTVIIGTREDNGPTVIVNDNNQAYGIVPDIIRRIEEVSGLNIELRPQNINPPLELEGLDGFVPVSTDGIGYFHDFSLTAPVLKLLPSVFSRSEKANRVQAIEDLAGRRVAYRINAASLPEVLTAESNRQHLTQVLTALEGFTLLQENEVDFFIGATLDNYNLSSHMIPDIKTAHIIQDKTIETGFAISNRHPELLSILNQSINRLGETFFSDTAQRWTGIATPTRKTTDFLTTQEQEWLQQHSQITLGFSLAAPPWLIKANDRYSGILPDIAKALSDLLGIDIRMTDDSWSNLLDQTRRREIDGLLLAPEKSLADNGLTPVGPPLFYITRALYARADNKISVHRPEDLIGKRVLYYSALFDDSSLIKPVADQIEIIKVPGPEEGLSALLNGEGDVLLGSSTEKYLIDNNNIPNIKPIYLQSDPKKGNMAVRDDWPLLANIINKGFQELGSEKIWQIQHEWLGTFTAIAGRFSEREMAYIHQLGKLRYHHIPNFPPISFIDQQGRPAGIITDYAQLLSDRLGIDIEPAFLPQDIHPLQALRDGAPDISLALQNLPDRHDELAFSAPYLSVPYSYIARKDVPIINNTEDLFEKTIGVAEDSLVYFYLSRHYGDKIHLKAYSDIADGLQDVEDGVTDGFIENEIFMDHTRRSMQDGELKYAGNLPFTYKPSISVLHKNRALIPIINKVLSDISDREKQLIYRRWTSFPSRSQTDWIELAGWIAVIATMAVAIIITILYWNRKLAAARNEAERANQAKSLFLANMSHEIRTPMNAILGFAEIMQQDQNLSAEHKQSLNVIHNAGNHLLSLINDILDISKIEAGRVKIVHQPCRLREMLQGLEQMFQISATRKGLNLSVAGIDTLPEVILTDEGKLRQILINLIGNAIKFTEQGSIRCDCGYQAREDDRVTIAITVKDTGPGIEDSDKEKVFSSFEQTRTSDTREDGTGLGMAISKTYAQLMGGDIVLQSEVGEGSCFTFSFAGQIAMVAKDDPTQPVAGLDLQGQSPLVLVVDDNQANRSLAAGILAPLGFRISEAHNGVDAIDQYRRQRPDIVLMDIRMPEMDGQEATQVIHRSAPDLPVIAMTAGVLDKHRDNMQNTGFNAFLDKPFKRGDLLRAIAEQLGLKLIAAEPATSQKPVGKTPPLQSPEQQTVLIVDDVPTNRLLLEKLLTREGFRCEQCENGQEALRRLETQKPDLVLLDIQMPIMDGYEVLRHIQNHPEEAFPPVIAVTAEYSSEEEKKLSALGATAICSKPVTLEKLRLMLEVALQTR